MRTKLDLPAELKVTEETEGGRSLRSLRLLLWSPPAALSARLRLKLGRSIATVTGEEHLCRAGGVALECVAKGMLARGQCFVRVWVQPAAGDAGGAVGAALVAAHMVQGQERPTGAPDGMRGAYLGPSYAQADIERRLNGAGAAFERVDDETLIERCAAALAGGKALGWHQGRMEFGPRALGARSILGDPRSPGMQKLLNVKVKFRESLRPFAPPVLCEDVAEWFALDGDSPYMSLVSTCWTATGSRSRTSRRRCSESTG